MTFEEFWEENYAKDFGECEPYYGIASHAFEAGQEDCGCVHTDNSAGGDGMTVAEKFAEGFEEAYVPLIAPIEDRMYQLSKTEIVNILKDCSVDSFLAGFKAQSQWHDLRKNPDDLPKEDCEVIVIFENGNACRQGWSHGEWTNAILVPIVAWCELPNFERKKQKDAKKAGWHDLRKNPYDLPDAGFYWCRLKNGTEGEYECELYEGARYWHALTLEDVDVTDDVIAWYEIPKFEEE